MLVAAERREGSFHFGGRHLNFIAAFCGCVVGAADESRFRGRDGCSLLTFLDILDSRTMSNERRG
jgi:hypothetical protein